MRVEYSINLSDIYGYILGLIINKLPNNYKVYIKPTYTPNEIRSLGNYTHITLVPTNYEIKHPDVMLTFDVFVQNDIHSFAFDPRFSDIFSESDYVKIKKYPLEGRILSGREIGVETQYITKTQMTLLINYAANVFD